MKMKKRIRQNKQKPETLIKQSKAKQSKAKICRKYQYPSHKMTVQLKIKTTTTIIQSTKKVTRGHEQKTKKTPQITF